MTFHYVHPLATTLLSRLAEPPRSIQILAGPRQVGKTTLVTAIVAARDPRSARYVSASPAPDPSIAAGVVTTESAVTPPRFAASDSAWLVDQWQRAANQASAWNTDDGAADKEPYVLVIDEIQKVTNWSEAVKGLWDQNLRNRRPMHVMLLGSSPLLMQKGLSESLAGRFELIRMPHWSFDEMNDAFGWTLDQYVYFGGYPGSARQVSDEARWRNFVRDALIGPNIEKDVLEMTRVDQPAVLKQLFEVGCRYSGQVVALDKVLGILNSKGNTVTLARYLELLGQAGLLRGLHKYSAHEIRSRRSPPKFQVLNTALMSAMGSHGFAEAKADRSYWGRLVESSAGAHLCNTSDANIAVHYWRKAPDEVDFVVNIGKALLAIEVKSGNADGPKHGLDHFLRSHPGSQSLVVGSDDCPLGEFLREPVSHWLR